MTAPGVPLGDGLVLVVDDDPDLLEILTDRLQAEGYRVVTAGDGLEALEWVRTVRPGCIILDLKMPRLSGFDALVELRQAAPDARVIILTGSPNRPSAQACRARGADDFLLKLVDLNDPAQSWIRELQIAVNHGATRNPAATGSRLDAGSGSRSPRRPRAN